MNIRQNNLKEAKSPYLQQHAQNPVHWQAWSQTVLQAAQADDKLLIVSIGYSACHWCHVMEAEVFEKQEAAEVMNAHFVSIKVDREERPDIDEIYMRALQLMNGQGGWPLNVVCLPDGKPIWGGTYVPRDKWLSVLNQLADMYRDDRQRMVDYGAQLTEGIKQSMLVSLERSPLQIEATELDGLFDIWQRSFDTEEGGSNRAPKFPMPVNWNYLLEYGTSRNNEFALAQVQLSLNKMAFGGIYDQIGGGFARYSVDGIWKVPHFEKMLYDNAQLLGLYSKAHRKFKSPLYQEVVEDTWQFILRELSHPSGAKYSALDADSEGVEGKYYVWTAEELQKLIPAADWAFFAATYEVSKEGYWEHGNYILLRKQSDEELGIRFQKSPEEVYDKREEWKQILLTARAKRIAPGLDNKALCSWNALFITGACEAYRAFGKKEYRQEAEKTAQWILSAQKQANNQLLHAWQEGEAHIEGLLEDYAFAIEAFIQLWQISGNTEYIEQARVWTELVLQNFEDRQSGLFRTRAHTGEQLISHGMETQDNVIPSANSTMAHNLWLLGLVYGKSAWTEQARQNFAHIKKQCLEYGESFANWARLGLYIAQPFFEIAVVGPEAEAYSREIHQDLNPLNWVFFSAKESSFPPFAGRYKTDTTLIYPCQQGACQLPHSSVEAFKAG